MILLFKRRREREKALAAENAAKASKSQVPTSSRQSNFEKFNQRSSRSLSPLPSTSKTSPKSRTLPQAASSSKASGSTGDLRTSSLKLPKSNGTERRKSSGNADESSAGNEEQVNNTMDTSDTAEATKPVTSTDDHLWSSNDQLDRNLPFIPSVGRAKVTYSYEPPQAIGSPDSPDQPDSNPSLSYLLTSCVSGNQRSSVSSLSPASEPIFEFPTAPKISIEDFGNLPSYDDVMASVDIDDREP